ncbi:Uncharacterized protein BP5553_00765 [Venustampulla echinocandica]|uniref:Defect at low temperature protein 1 n=1 Tax=Venustampulla echinocandica TaxID=2656787 RepID=A0A370TZ39_9HELO|nr:Uncharacterized protein BP5553_00765 [Venustampulla echinocandica]RDL40786.1 Uncharacterized protein BP5553_00765 [Venustampulla echinocandica]
MNLRLLFRIFYTSFFTILCIVLVGLLTITPADAIRQALTNKQLYNVFVIAGCYFITIFFAFLIYASRLYTNRAVLSGIPKTWIPVEKGEVTKYVRRMIVAGLNRSAAIAWDSRPRISPQPAITVSVPDARDSIAKLPDSEGKDRESGWLRRKLQSEKEEDTIDILPPRPVWGEISHNGWASPTSPDLPNLQYTIVILELPHLIEARAVSLAPLDTESNPEQPMPDIRAVQLLQRTASVGLRDYIGHLISIGVITSTSAAGQFLISYECARFGSRAISEHNFRVLMNEFAEVLRSMAPLSPPILGSLGIELEGNSYHDASLSSTPKTPRSPSLASSRSLTSRSGSEGTIRTARSRAIDTSRNSPMKRSIFSTAPATPRSRNCVVSRKPSADSFAQSRRPYNGSSSSSSGSLRSTSQGSVVKLNMSDQEGDLPYTLNIPRTWN